MPFTHLSDHWVCNEVPLPLSFLSSGEREALLIAADREADVDSPIAALLHLDPASSKMGNAASRLLQQIGGPQGEAPNLS